ncbi:FACT complex subunit Spt16p [Diutina catenulata]
MTDVHIDAQAFHKRLSILQANMVVDKLQQAVVVVGARDDDNTYKKSTVTQTWLLGYEFNQTIIYITQNKCVFVTSEGKAKFLKGLTTRPSANSSEVEIWERTKDKDHNAEGLTKLAKMVADTDGGRYGTVVKDQYRGKIVDEWKEALGSTGTAEDITGLLSRSMEVKDADEFAATQTAAQASTAMMEIVTDDMMAIIDDEKKIANSAFSDKIEEKLDSAKWFSKSKFGKQHLATSRDFDTDQLDWCYSPIIQSGGEYDLKPSAVSSDSPVKGDVVVASVGLRYKSYCSNLARTFMIDPTKDMEENYSFLLELQAKVASEYLKEGATASEVYNKAVEYINATKPELASHFTKNAGWLTGIDFRDSSFVLNAKTDRKLQAGQIFSVTMGFSGLSSKRGSYALLLTDTFKVNDGAALALTTSPKTLKEVTFYFNDDDVKKPKPTVPKREVIDAGPRGKRLREETTATDHNAEKVRQEIQTKLHEKRQQEGLARFSKADATDSADLKPVFKKYESYVKDSQIPSSVRDLKIHFDVKNHTILLPICGRPVPFHINSFKNGSQNEEGDYTYLRLNFNSPGAGGNMSKRTELPYEDTGDNTFIRSFTYRSRDRQRMVDVLKAIQDLKKDATKREQERKQMADVVTQASLIEIKGRFKKLDNVFMRPPPDSKKLGGVLQIHENGLRYQSSFRADQKVDVLFSNIKHLFFQPCKDELIVIIHCHLKTPIMIGKKKTFDVQFYREASDMAFDETGGRKRRYRYGDEDELQQEQEERRRKALLDKEFKSFAEQIADASNGMVDLDIPFRELGFQGVPFRSAVLCMPTRDCLIQLIDPPYLVVTLDEIEIAHLERVQFGLRNFDLVFVFKDFSKPVVHINTIPMEVLEDVKAWLTNVDIPMSEGPMNLNWGTIMKTVQSDPYQFFLDGGWSFLSGEGDSEEEDEEDEESEFEVSDDDPSDEEVSAGEEESEDYSSGSGSDDDASDVAGSEEEEDEEIWDD